MAVAAAAIVVYLSHSAQAAEGRPCDLETDAELKFRLGEIDDQLTKIWTRRGPDWIVAYDIAGSAKNPFDVKGQGSGVAASHGFAWLRDVSCTLAEKKTADTITVTYTAAAFRFKEGGSKWIEPMTNGAIAEYLLTRNGASWTIKDLSRDETIFLPESAMRMPRADELPPQKAWPDKRCPLPKIWQGVDCILPDQKSNGSATEKPHAD